MLKKLCVIVFAALIFFSCRTTTQTESGETEQKVPQENIQEVQPEEPDAKTAEQAEMSLSLLFAGDIMAHTQNFSIDDYDKIWDDIRTQVSAADISFANLEAPVVKDLPFKTYPTFNMQPSYPQAAFKAGFNLISLANNHTDDQNAKGIAATQLWAKQVAEETREGARPVYFSGIVHDGDFTFAQFNSRKYSVLFIAATEYINTWKNYELINYIPPSANGRAAFTERIRKMKEEYSPDLFIVSIHTSEEEYVLTVRESVRNFYHDLLAAGADIVVSNHPHVVRPVEFIVNGSKQADRIRKVIMYANGNTISGQRRSINYKDPQDIWQYTGDGQLVSLLLSRDEQGWFVQEHSVQFITAYTPPEEVGPVIKKLDEDFIHSLQEQGNNADAEYFKARLETLKNIKGIYTWQ